MTHLDSSECNLGFLYSKNASHHEDNGGKTKALCQRECGEHDAWSKGASCCQGEGTKHQQVHHTKRHVEESHIHCSEHASCKDDSNFFPVGVHSA